MIMDKKLIVAGAVGLLGLAYLLSQGGDKPLGSAGGGGSSGFVISPVPPGDGESLIREEGDGGVVYNIAMPAPAPVELPPPDVVFATPDYPDKTNGKKKTIAAPGSSLGSPVDTFGTRTDTGEAIPVYEGGSSLNVFAIGPSGYSTQQPVFSAPAESKKDSLATPAPTTFVGTVDAGYASGGILGGLSAAVRSVFGGWF